MKKTRVFIAGGVLVVGMAAVGFLFGTVELQKPKD